MDWGEGGAHGGGGGWLDAVRRDGDDMDRMLGRVEREVGEDVEELERRARITGREWRKPVVRGVRDRNALVKDWQR